MAQATRSFLLRTMPTFLDLPAGGLLARLLTGPSLHRSLRLDHAARASAAHDITVKEDPT
ncbi:MAG: hypothetical protein U0Z70_19555 [Thermomicrobiales bacterium]|jgi:hypothetical protein